MNDLFTAESYLDGLTASGVGLSEVVMTKVNVKTLNSIAGHNMLDQFLGSDKNHGEYQFLGHPIDLDLSLDDDEVVIIYERDGDVTEVTMRLEAKP